MLDRIKLVLDRVKCLFGFHDYKLIEMNFGECGDALFSLLAKGSMVRAKLENNYYIEHWKECRRCKILKPRGWLKDIYDLKGFDNHE